MPVHSGYGGAPGGAERWRGGGQTSSGRRENTMSRNSRHEGSLGFGGEGLQLMFGSIQRCSAIPRAIRSPGGMFAAPVCRCIQAEANRLTLDFYLSHRFCLCSYCLWSFPSGGEGCGFRVSGPVSLGPVLLTPLQASKGPGQGWGSPADSSPLGVCALAGSDALRVSGIRASPAGPRCMGRSSTRNWTPG